MGIKEANSGGPAAQILDRLGIRAIIVQGAPQDHRFYCLFISKDKTALIPADQYRRMKNYELVSQLRKQYGEKIAVISTGIAGERKYKGASVSFTDIFVDPSRNAAREGNWRSDGIKGSQSDHHRSRANGSGGYRRSGRISKIVHSWVDTLKHDISCSLYSRFGTPFAINNSASHGTLPANNYRSGRPENFIAVSGNSIQTILFEPAAKCTAACLAASSSVRSSIPTYRRKHLCAAYEYELIAMLEQISALPIPTRSHGSNSCVTTSVSMP